VTVLTVWEIIALIDQELEGIEESVEKTKGLLSNLEDIIKKEGSDGQKEEKEG
jgi:hypothetical protein